MKLFKKTVINLVFYTAPLALICYLFLGLSDSTITSSLESISFWASLPIIFWTPITFFLTISMFFSKSLRNDVLVRLSGMKERDEREVQIVGKALKSSFLTTMTLLLFLLFISLFYVHIGKKPDSSIESGQPPYELHIKLEFHLIDSNTVVTHKPGFEKYFEVNDLPISSSTLILILLLWQIFSYRKVSRRSLKLFEEEFDY